MRHGGTIAMRSRAKNAILRPFGLRSDSLLMSRITSFLYTRRRSLIGLLVIPLVLVIGAVLAVVIVSPRLTPYLEGPDFRAELDKQTSKGLHFEGMYAPIRRTGFDTAQTDGFRAKAGIKAMKSLDASGVEAKFNPWGVLLRRWQLDYVRIKKGTVEIQTYEPKPDNKPPKPWYSIFLPSHVYLREVTCDDADVTWRIQEKPGGIFGTQLKILPYGRDFEYFAEGGVMRTGGITQELDVREIHMVITKQILELYAMNLAPRDRKSGSISVTGRMGMRDEKHIDMNLVFADLPIGQWLPADIRENARGTATGELHWTGDEQTLEASSGTGHVSISDGKLIELPAMEVIAAAAAKSSLKTIILNRANLAFRWKYPRIEIHEIEVSGDGKLSLLGSLEINQDSLSGTLDLGIAPEYLEWLPKASETIFTREADGLIWTKVQLSGTLQNPQEDLTPRLATALKRDPAAAAGMFLRGAGQWIENKLKGK